MKGTRTTKPARKRSVKDLEARKGQDAKGGESWFNTLVALGGPDIDKPTLHNTKQRTLREEGRHESEEEHGQGAVKRAAKDLAPRKSKDVKGGSFHMEGVRQEHHAKLSRGHCPSQATGQTRQV